MTSVQVQFLGSGDAFGSGGRFQTCMLVKTTKTQFLIDCGASSLIPMRRYKVDPNSISTILLTHLHADHFGGIPFFLLDAQLVSKRIRSIVIAGPTGTRKRVEGLMEAMFPSSSTMHFTYPMEFVELEPETPRRLNGITVVPYLAEHPSGSPSLTLRVECEGRIITYTGDTEWTDSLLEAAHDSNLLIAEAYFFEQKVKFHLDFRTLASHLDQLRSKRVIVTHMSSDMLSRLDQIDCEYAEDGKLLDL
jgi:ribonuclease BN (tRNA processing enzyme)